MEIGLALPQYDYSVPGESPLEWSTVQAWADRAASLGFASLWVSDHLFLSLEKYGGPADRFACFDPITAMGALAMRHPTMTVGCLVFCAPLRPPKLLAKQLETLDNLAPGRIVAGLGAGWYEPDFERSGVVFGSPGDRLRVLTEATADIGGFLAERDIPIWYGGKGDRLIDLAVRHADGWNTVWAWTPGAYRERVARVERACDAVGRDPASFTLSLGLTTIVGTTEADVARRWEARRRAAPSGMLDTIDFPQWRSERLVGTADQIGEQASIWRDLGVRLLIVNLGALPFSVTESDDLDLVASALM